jgi:hypothetical protein
MAISLNQILEGDLLGWIIIAVIVIGVLGYNGFQMWKEDPEFIEQLPATVLQLVTRDSVEVELEEPSEPTIIIPQEISYIETAESGEGITHLARRSLRKYLTERPHNPELTPEHKIYIEDFLAKAKGNGLLSLGEQLEFSEDLLKEAISEAETLTPEQLQNLTQFSQLIPSLNY